MTTLADDSGGIDGILIYCYGRLLRRDLIYRLAFVDLIESAVRQESPEVTL